MIDDERVVALVPARGGSKSVPDKNVRRLGGKPLVGWPIDVAAATDAVDRVVVSTDDERIASVAREFGADVLDRPPELARDDSLVIETIRHTVEELAGRGETAQYVAMLEPTCPLRAPQDVERCLDRLAGSDLDSVATFVEAEVNPHRTWRLDEDAPPEPFVDGADPWQPRQSLPEAYQLNGGVYAFDVDAVPDEGVSLLFGDADGVVMPPERSVDIDTEVDFALAEAVLEERDGTATSPDGGRPTAGGSGTGGVADGG
ncbi:cytidylyltransferase domain-containing protein [Salinirubellus sp. GCM10025818]|uniref:acylneuraminate cytidylyltransferase family protein n=1 Tax=Salinirubellus TaxID=2162630 RepID=UPI0030D32722